MFFNLIEKIYPSIPRVIDKSPESIVGMLLGPEHAWGDTEAIERTYENIGWVYRCIDITATNIAQLPIYVVQTDRSGKETDVTDQDDFLIFRSPNKFQTIYDFIYESISRLRLQGELYWEIQRDERSNRVIALYADWSADEVEIVPDPENLIKLYRRMVNGKKYEFLPEEVFYIKYFNPFSVLRGMAPLRSGRKSMSLELNVMGSNNRFFENGMQSPGAFTTEQTISTTERDRLREVLKQYYRGDKNWWEPILLWGGLKFDPFNTMSLKDTGNIDLRKMNREDIAGILGVPLEILGIGKDTYQNMQFAWKTFWSDTLKPTISKVQALINKSLIPRLTRNDRVKAVFDLSEVEALKEDLEQKIKIYDTGFKNGALTPNDIRVDVFGKDPINDPASNQTYLPGTFLPSGTEQQTKIKSKALILFRDASTKEGRDKIWKDKIAGLAKFEKRFHKMMVDFFTKQEKEVIKNLGGKKSKAPLVLEGGDVFNLQKWIDELKETSEPLITEIILAAAAEYIDEFDLTHPAVAASLGQRVERFSRFTNENTARKIADQLREGFSSNESIAQISQRLRDNVFSEVITDKRANLIARTEAVGSSNYGTQQGLVQAGIQNKMWITSRDDRVRDTHQIDGQVVGVNQNFQLLDGQLMPFPQDFNERCICIGTNEPRTI